MIRGNIIGVDATVTRLAAQRHRDRRVTGDAADPDRRQRCRRRQHRQRQLRASGISAGNRAERRSPSRATSSAPTAVGRAISGTARGGIVVSPGHDGTGALVGGVGPGEGNVIAYNGGRPGGYPAGVSILSFSTNRVTVRGQSDLRELLARLRAGLRRAGAQRSARRRHGRQQSPELSDHHRRRLRSAHRGPRDAEQRTVDDLRRRLLRERRLRHAADRLPAGPGLRRLHAGHDQRLRDRHDRLLSRQRL